MYLIHTCCSLQLIIMDNSVLLSLAMNNDINSMKLLLSSGCIDMDDENLQLLLYHLIEVNQIETLERFLQYGLDPNRKLSYLFTPEEKNMLASAISRKKYDVVTLLIKYGAKVDVNDHFYIMDAVTFKPSLEDELLRLFYTNVSLTDFHEYGYTALHLAVLDNNPDYVKILLNRGADVNVKDTWFLTPLHCALDRYDQDRYNFEYRYMSLRSKGRSDFFKAKVTNLLKIVKILLEYGADVKSSQGDYENMIECVIDCGKSFKRINHVLIRHIAMLEFLKLKDTPKDVALSIKNNPELKFFYEKCLDELQIMKKQMVAGMDVELSEILDKKSGGVLRCIRSPDFADAVDIHANTKDYPIYRDLLVRNFKFTIIRCQLHNRAARALVKVSKCSFLSVSHLVTERILQFLSVGDLENLSNI